jgi:hypothetical protein
MSLEIGPTSIQRSSPQSTAASRSRPADAPSFAAALEAVTPAAARTDSFQVGIPANPPESVRDAIGVAADRADTLREARRELHFHADEASGRVIVQVRDLGTGEVIRTIPPSGALDFLSGGQLHA